MPIYPDSDTGFPSEIPCSGCGWPLYCCLCSSEDDEEVEAAEQLRAADGAWRCACGVEVPAHYPNCFRCGALPPRQ